jgi:hypothetical protein
MDGSFSYSTLKTAADSAYKKESFEEAAKLYTKILEECTLPDQEINKIRGNRCLASQKSGEVLTLRDTDLFWPRSKVTVDEHHTKERS